MVRRGSRGSRGEAGTGRHPRHRVRDPAAAARARRARCRRCGARTRSMRLDEMADGGYVDAEDADALAAHTGSCGRSSIACSSSTSSRCTSSRRHRRHRLGSPASMGYRDTGVGRRARAVLRRSRAGTRRRCASIHERLYFRPLLEAFAALPSGSGEAELPSRPGAAEARLAAFGFTDADRTTAAVTRADPRSHSFAPPDAADAAAAARLAGSTRPIPTRACLCLRNLRRRSQRSTELAVARSATRPRRRGALCRSSERAAWSRTLVLHNPDLIARLPYSDRLRTQPKRDLVDSARKALAWREDVEERQAGLRRWKERHLVGIAARDVLEGGRCRRRRTRRERARRRRRSRSRSTRSIRRFRSR